MSNIKYCKHCKKTRYCKHIVMKDSSWVWIVCNKCNAILGCY